MLGLASPSTKKSVLWLLYKELVHNNSTPTNLSQIEIDEKVTAMFELEAKSHH